MILPQPITIDPTTPESEQDVEALTKGSGVYAIHMRDTVPHLSSCAYLRARVRRLLQIGASGSDDDEPNKGSRLRWRDSILRIDCWPASSRLDTWLLLLGLAQEFYPDEYDRKLRLRRPWFVELSTERFARIAASSRLQGQEENLYGPFPTRDAAAAYAEVTAGLFQIRKCAEPLFPSPDHPGCIYGEMNQCLRPCQCAVSDDEYASETARVGEFLRSNGNTTRSALLVARERASEALDFEVAANIHKRLERLTTAIALRDEPAGSIAGFGGVAVTRSLEEGAVRLWPMREAVWLMPLDIAVQRSDASARSLDSRLREEVNAALVAPPDQNADRSAHLAILLRWYRSSYRDGEWVQDVPGKGISYRKVVGAISRLMKK